MFKLSVSLAPDGMGNFERKGRTNNSPIEERRLFPLFFSPFFRFDEVEEVPTGGPCRQPVNSKVNANGKKSFEEKHQKQPLTLQSRRVNLLHFF